MTGTSGDDLEAGSSRRHAIVVSSVAEEYAWLREHFPGYQVTLQELRLFPDGVFDVLQIESQDGKAREVYFALRWLSRRWTRPATR